MARAGVSGRTKSVFVCCHAPELDLQRPKVVQALAALGRSALMFPGLWYLETPLSASDVKAKLARALDENASFAVIDATNHEAAWGNIRPEAAEAIRQNWQNGALPSGLAVGTAPPRSRAEPSAK